MILLTGVSGFVGSFLIKALGGSGIRAIGREFISSADLFGCGDVAVQGGQKASLTDVVVHCAARVHITADDAEDPLSAFRAVNVEGTVNLARQAAKAGVKRFIFLSSVKVNGEVSDVASIEGDVGVFTADDKPAPEDPYGISKNEAEEALKAICAETGMEYVIIRPPLVYGPNVKANFSSMLKWVARGVPLPLGGIKTNKRSLVYVDNLVDLIKVCIEHPAAANQTFLVSDDEGVSTRELLESVAKALGVKSRLLPIPPSWLGFVGKLLGKKDIEQRLCGSLQVDIEHTKNTLSWEPPYSMEEGLARTAEWFKNRS